MAPTPVCAVNKRNGTVVTLLSDMHCVVPPVAGRPSLYRKSGRPVSLAGVAREIIKQQQKNGVATGFTLGSGNGQTLARLPPSSPSSRQLVSPPYCTDTPSNAALSTYSTQTVPVKHAANGSLLPLSKSHVVVDEDMSDCPPATPKSTEQVEPSAIDQSNPILEDGNKSDTRESDACNGCKPFYEHEVPLESCPVGVCPGSTDDSCCFVSSESRVENCCLESGVDDSYIGIGSGEISCDNVTGICSESISGVSECHPSAVGGHVLARSLARTVSRGDGGGGDAGDPPRGGGGDAGDPPRGGGGDSLAHSVDGTLHSRCDETAVPQARRLVFSHSACGDGVMSSQSGTGNTVAPSISDDISASSHVCVDTCLQSQLGSGAPLPSTTPSVGLLTCGAAIDVSACPGDKMRNRSSTSSCAAVAGAHTSHIRSLATQNVLEQRCSGLLRRLWQLQARVLQSQFRSVCASLELVSPLESLPPGGGYGGECLMTARHQLQGLSRQLDDEATESSSSDSECESGDGRSRLSQSRLQQEMSVLTSRWMRNSCQVSALDDKIHQLRSLQRRVRRRRQWLSADESSSPLPSCSRTTALQSPSPATAAVHGDWRRRRRLVRLARMAERPPHRCWRCRTANSACMACRGTSAAGGNSSTNVEGSDGYDMCCTRDLADSEWRRKYLYPSVSALSSLASQSECEQQQQDPSATDPASSTTTSHRVHDPATTTAGTTSWPTALQPPPFISATDNVPASALHRSGRALRRHHVSSYDVDLVLPPGVAATGKIERLKCKDITTPGWRDVPLSSSSSEACLQPLMQENLSDAEFLRRHAVSEARERSRLFKHAADASEYAVTVQSPARLFPVRQFPLSDCECRSLLSQQAARSIKKRPSLHHMDSSPPSQLLDVEVSSISSASSSVPNRSPVHDEDTGNGN